MGNSGPTVVKKQRLGAYGNGAWVRLLLENRLLLALRPANGRQTFRR